ncbi:alpha/beta fold hydrolase [Aquabacter spiritensis]|uniref:Lysophospholipase n=1 Tax=Aquabacter spiritensis TaxID=933073 RepID=A0A4R3M236_9HYPH|nr:alpha/beta hydrolase [Aquabacter spiritensis]TCT06259.1 lysophospholipase [Aquabacter spiritensis]
MPAGAVAGYLTTADGIQVRYARWPAAPGVPARGTVAVLPGRTEFIEKYFEVVRELAARGFAVAMLDWRGQGGSERLLRNPRKGFVRDFRDYQNDLSVFARQVLLPDCPAPHFALGHSMASVILLEAVLEGRRWFDRMVMVAPMLALNLGPATGMARLLAGVLAPWMGGAYIPGGRNRPVTERPFATNPVTSDAKRYARAADMVAAHPELAMGAPTIGWLAAAFAAMDRLSQPETMRRIRQPILMVAAGADRIISNRAIEHLSGRLIAGGHVTIAGARHEILQEQDIYRAQFWAAFDAFIPGSDGA